MTDDSNPTTKDDQKAPAANEKKKLALGTSPQYARMHTIVRRTCYVLLFGLVLEGALTFPLLAAWYGFPQLSLTEVCSEMDKLRYSDASRECEVPYDFPGPPLAGPAEAEGQDTSRDVEGVQPKPLYPDVDFREFVERHDACEDFDADAVAARDPDSRTPEEQRLWDYCSYISEER